MATESEKPQTIKTKGKFNPNEPLPEPEPNAPPLPRGLYKNKTDAWSKLNPGQSIGEFKKKHGFVKVTKEMKKTQGDIEQPYEKEPSMVEAIKAWKEDQKKLSEAREQYKKEFPNAYDHAMGKIQLVRYQNKNDPEIIEKKRKKKEEEEKKKKREMEEEADDIHKKFKRILPDDVTEELADLERNVNAEILRSARTISDEFRKSLTGIYMFYRESSNA